MPLWTAGFARYPGVQRPAGGIEWCAGISLITLTAVGAVKDSVGGSLHVDDERLAQRNEQTRRQGGPTLWAGGRERIVDAFLEPCQRYRRGFLEAHRSVIASDMAIDIKGAR